MGEKMAMTPEHMLKQCGTEKSSDTAGKKQAGVTPAAPQWDQDKAEKVVHKGKDV